MKRQLFYLIISLFCCCAHISAQQAEKSELQQRAEAESARGNVATARYTYIRAFEDYTGRGLTAEGIGCAVKATALYYKENYYKEAFELLRRADQAINASSADKNALHYMVTKERLQMYMKLRKSASAQEQLNIMENQVGAAGIDSLKNDLLYNKAIYYYSFGQTEKGNEVFQEMASKLTADKDYDKVDEVFQTLIANGRKSNSASLVAQSYSNYVVWKDSVNAMKLAEETGALKQQIAADEAIIAEKDSSLSSRRLVIIGLCVLAAILAAALVLGALVLMRFIMLTRKQKNTIRQLNENNALKAKFISNISSQLNPSLQKLDASIPEVKALQDFSSHIQTLAQLDCLPEGEVPEMETIQVQPFCEQLMEEIRPKVKRGVELIVKAPKLSAQINKEYVTHILRHLLNNATIYTPEDGHITLDFKKRSVHTQQFLVWNTGTPIPEEKREDVFKPFLEIKDLSQGDGLGLPICKTMAQKMDGDLTIDSSFAKGTRFVLDLHV
jgi:two-component sensor histidine kinase